MPTYLLHGFRWPRPLVRIHIIMQNLDDAAPEWLVAPETTLALLKNFHELYPECMQHLNSLRFVEQYDPSTIAAATGPSQPFAYVADLVEEVSLGLEIDEVRGKGLANEQWGALMELRDKIAPEEKVGWYIVVCGDEERVARPVAAAPDRKSEVPSEASGAASAASIARNKPTATPATTIAQPTPKGFKKFFRFGRSKSRDQLADNKATGSQSKASIAASQEEAESSSGRPALPSSLDTARSGGSSSTPSIPPSASASTPPLPDDIAELPAMTPTSSRGSTPPPDELNFIPDLEMATKYRRTSQIPDYRATVFPAVEPKYANMPPIEPEKKVPVRQSSDAPPIPQRSEGRNSARRHSDLSSLRSTSPRNSDGYSDGRRRSDSPDLIAQGRRVMSIPNMRSGTVSPLTFRSISPSGRSVARSYSPVRSGAVSPLVQDEPSLTRAQHRTSVQLRMQRRSQMTALVTKIPDATPNQPGPNQETANDDDEEMDEVIMMSPAVRAPPKQFFRRSGTATSFMSSANVAGLDSIVESDGRPYFGQEVNEKDLLAVNLENAFDHF